MITFYGKNNVEVEHKPYGPLNFKVRPMKDNESLAAYMEHIMNAYWAKVGKNRRSYYEEYE